MTDHTARAEDDAGMPQNDGGRDEAQSTGPSGGAPAPGQPDLVAVTTELRDRLLRTLAEMENLRKRTDREVADSRIYGVTSFARDILGVADNMRRALDALTPE